MGQNQHFPDCLCHYESIQCLLFLVINHKNNHLTVLTIKRATIIGDNTFKVFIKGVDNCTLDQYSSKDFAVKCQPLHKITRFSFNWICFCLIGDAFTWQTGVFTLCLTNFILVAVKAVEQY